MSHGCREAGLQDQDCSEQDSCTPQGTPQFHRIAEIHFPTIKALEACAASEGGKRTIANAVAISSGGEPIVLVAEEEVFLF